MSASTAAMSPPFPAERGLDVYNKKLGMWVFLASEVMFFAALIGSYVVLRFGAPGDQALEGGFQIGRVGELRQFADIAMD